MTIKPQLGQCPRCSGLAYVCDVDAIYTAADMAPLDQAGQLAAVVAGRDLYWLEHDRDTGRPSRLHLYVPGVVSPMISGVPILGSHGCGAEARSVVPWTPGAVERPKDPAAPLAQSPAPSASPFRSDLDLTERDLDSMMAGAEPVELAEPEWTPGQPNLPVIDWARVDADMERRKTMPDCEICKLKIDPHDEMIGIELGDLWVWARHTERCV